MANTYKSAQLQGTAALSTYGSLYFTGAATTAIISSIVVCNTSASAVLFRVGLMGTAGTPSASEFIVYDASLAGNDTIALTLGLTMGNSQFLRVSSSANTLAFYAAVGEIS